MAIAFLFMVALILDAKKQKAAISSRLWWNLELFYYCFCDPLRFSTSAANVNQ
jgi:hypothetical protein